MIIANFTTLIMVFQGVFYFNVLEQIRPSNIPETGSAGVLLSNFHAGQKIFVNQMQCFVF
jgi:hypothetical protein